jgi:chlorophyll(ide) b reductase
MSAWAWVAASDADAAMTATTTAAASVPPSDAALLGALLGASLGGAFAALSSYARRSVFRAPARRLRVVVTGGTRGLGKALARELLAAGDAVAVTGRGEEAVAEALRELPAEAVALLRASGQAQEVSEDTYNEIRRRLAGFVCDVAADDAGASVQGAFDGAAAFFAAAADGDSSNSNGFDVLICNAGASGGAKALFDAQAEDQNQDDDAKEAARLRSVVRTNLLGALRCAKSGLRHLSPSSSSTNSDDNTPSSARPSGHLFFMDGAGADGSATPMYSAYGGTKAALPQLARSLRAELKSSADASSSSSSSSVGIHTLSPGMMLTDLLLDGSPPAVRALVFNALCEQPETVAAFLAPRVRSAVARGLDATYPKFLTPLSAAVRFASLPVRSGTGGRGRFFDAEGKPTYLPEHERILGRGARATARARRAAGVASRWAPLRAAYSASLLACAVALASALGPVGVGDGVVVPPAGAAPAEVGVVVEGASAPAPAAVDEVPPMPL